MKEIPLVGYADKFSLEPDETINFKVSSNSTRPYSARLVRVISGDPNPEGPGLIEEELDASFNGKHPSRKQDIQTGSYIKVDTKSSLKDLKSFTFGATIWPTMPNKYLQTIISTFDTSSKTLSHKTIEYPCALDLVIEVNFFSLFLANSKAYLIILSVPFLVNTAVCKAISSSVP